MNLKFACSDQFESAEEIAKGIQGYLPNLIQNVAIVRTEAFVGIFEVWDARSRVERIIKPEEGFLPQMPPIDVATRGSPGFRLHLCPGGGHLQAPAQASSGALTAIVPLDWGRDQLRYPRKMERGKWKGEGGRWRMEKGRGAEERGSRGPERSEGTGAGKHRGRGDRGARGRGDQGKPCRISNSCSLCSVRRMPASSKRSSLWSAASTSGLSWRWRGEISTSSAISIPPRNTT